MLRSAIESVAVDPFLQKLSAVDQEEHRYKIPSLDCDQAKFYWIFRNVDFKQWNDLSGSQVLWLSGPPECSIHQTSSYIVDLAKNQLPASQHSVLYFFCSTASGQESTITNFVHTFLHQLVCCTPMDKKISIIKTFLHTLLNAILKKEPLSTPNQSRFLKRDSSNITIEKILNASTEDLWNALEAVLANDQKRKLSILIDGLDKVDNQNGEFIKGVRILIKHLQERISKVKALLTSRPRAEIKEVFDGLPCIEFDKERTGLVEPYLLDLN